MSETPDEGWERDDCIRRTIVLPTELAERLAEECLETRGERRTVDPFGFGVLGVWIGFALSLWLFSLLLTVRFKNLTANGHLPAAP